MNLLDAFLEEPTLTARTVLWLVEHLPDDSATSAEFRGGPQFRAWTQQTYLQAAMVNMLYAANRQRGGKATRSPVVKPPKAKSKEAVKVLDLRAVQARIRAQELSKQLHAKAQAAEVQAQMQALMEQVSDTIAAAPPLKLSSVGEVEESALKGLPEHLS